MLFSPARPRVACEFGFGVDLSAEQTQAFLAAVSGLPRRAVVELDLLVDEDGVRHFVRSETGVVDALQLQLEGLLPEATLTRLGSPPNLGAFRVGWQGSWSGRHPLLRTDAAEESAASLIASTGSLRRHEKLLVRLTLRPAAPRVLPQRSSHEQQGTLARLVFGPPPEGAVLAQVRAKQAGPLLHASFLVAAAAVNERRAEQLLARAAAVLRTRRGARGSFAYRRLRGSALDRSLDRPPRAGAVFSPAELAAVCGWPVGAPPLAGLKLGTAPRRSPDRRIPSTGRVLARSTWPAASGRLLAQPVLGALSHSVCAGPTGVGKSELIAQLALADMREGRGVLVLDGKGDLAEALLERVPEERLDDVIVLDPARRGAVPGLRVFGDRGDHELAADVALGVLRDVFHDSWGIRSESWLRAGLVTVAHDPRGTLGDVRFLFADERYRRELVGRLRDPMLKATWAAFEAMSPGERANQLGAPLTKLNELLGRRVVRSVLSQANPTLDLHDVLRQRRIVIASLSPGRLGSPAARLLGALLIHALFGAVQARGGLPTSRRSPFFVYLDEPRVLVDLPVPLDNLFELARGLGVGLAISAQSLGQLPGSVHEAVLTNARSLVAFQQSADDAELLARELPGISGEQLQHLGQYEIVARIALGPGDTARPATGLTLPLPPASQDPERVRQRSGDLYGRHPAAIDRDLAARHGQHESATEAVDDVPIGRTRRSR